MDSLSYPRFLMRFPLWVSKLSGLGLGMDSMRMYPYGYTPRGSEHHAQEVVRSINRKFYNVDSDTMRNDYMELFPPGQYSGTGRIFEMPYLYEEYLRAGWDKVTEIVKESLQQGDRAEGMELLDHLFDYDTVKERIYVRLMNWPDFRYTFRENFVRKEGDIALVPSVLIRTMKKGYRTEAVSMRVKTSMAQEWGITESELWEQAMINSYLLAQPRMYLHLKETQDPPYDRGAFMAFGSRMRLAADDKPIVTTTLLANGAGAMFYPGVAKRISEMWGNSDYLIAFTSTDGARLHKAGTISAETLANRIDALNKEWPDSMLTRKVYRYDTAQDCILVEKI